MDAKIEYCLVKNKLNPLISTFKEFDYNTFIHLNANHLRELIPNVYNRIRLESVLKEERNNTSSLASASHSSSHLFTSSIAQGHVWESPPHPAETELATPTTNSESNIVQGQDDIYSYDIDNNVEVRYVNNFVRVDISEDMDLHDIEDLDFKILAEKFKKDIPFNNKDQTIIAQCIIKFVLQNDYSRVINKEEFIMLRHAITKIFRSESPLVYYVPAHKCQVARGKLYCAYTQYRRELGSVDMIKIRAKSAPQTATLHEDEANAIIEENGNNESEHVSREWLEENAGPFDEVFSHWAQTRTSRFRMLKSEITTFEYLEKYPSLATINGYKLILSDAHFLYPNSEEGISRLLPIAKKIIQLARAKCDKTKDKGIQNILNLYGDETNDVSVQLVACFVLPHILQTSQRKRQKTEKGFRPTKAEAASFFVPYFTSSTEETAFEDSLLQDHRKNPAVPLQPRVFICGNFQSCRGCVTTITTKYYFSNPISAIDACFKIYLGLNSLYPRESEHVWEFFQKVIYKIETPHDKNFNTVLNLIHEIEK